MTRYCMETGVNAVTIHRVDCAAYDLGTLLGLGCIADLGECKSAAKALAAVRQVQPTAALCPDCCNAEVMYLPQICQPAPRRAGTLPSN